MSCNRGHVIIVWILESDVRGKRKLANSQTKRAKVRGRLAETQIGLKTFLTLFTLFLKSIVASSQWLTRMGCRFLWHIWLWAVIYHNGVIVVILGLKITAFFKWSIPWDGSALMEHTVVNGWKLRRMDKLIIRYINVSFSSSVMKNQHRLIYEVKDRFVSLRCSCCISLLGEKDRSRLFKN